jgi:hypothetical protein
MIEPKYLAPTALQRAASPFILVTTTYGMVETFRNTLELRVFQISHEVSMIRDANDFLLVPFLKMKLSHQSLTGSTLLQEEASMMSIPNQAKIEFILKQ